MNKIIKTLLTAMCAIYASAVSTTAIAQQKQTETGVIAKLDHAGLSVSNIDKMKTWYKACFNLQEIQHVEMENLHVRSVLLRAPNGFKVELIELEGSTREHNFTDPLNAASIQGYGHIALHVQNVREAFERLIKNGASQVIPPSPAVKRGDTYAYVKDIEGNLIELIQAGS